jgi:hypothetical protein
MQLPTGCRHIFLIWRATLATRSQSQFSLDGSSHGRVDYDCLDEYRCRFNGDEQSSHSSCLVGVGRWIGGPGEWLLAMVRYLANRGTASTILQFRNKPCLHDLWVDYAQSLMQLNQDQRRFQGIATTLEHAIADLLGQTVVAFGGCCPLWWGPRISVAFESKKRYGIISSHWNWYYD